MPRTPIHPGEILGDELEEIGLSAKRLADVIQVPPNRLYQILAGKRNMTADTALRLSQYFGMSAAFWMNLQSGYELDLARQVQLISALQIHPESGRHAEVLAEAESRVRRHVPLPSQNLVEPVGGHLDNIGEPFRRKADLFQFVAEDFSGVNGCAWHVLLPSSVVVDNLNIRWAQLILGPLKADAPLAVDPNGMLPLAVSLQGFQTAGIEGGKIPQRRGGVENA